MGREYFIGLAEDLVELYVLRYKLYVAERLNENVLNVKAPIKKWEPLT